MNHSLLAFILWTEIAGFAVAADPPSTFCNPLSIPDYPIGVRARGVTNGAPLDEDALWLSDHQEQFRELADPTAVWHDGKWYLYPSVDMAWVSADCGATWEHHPLNVRDIGYAPTVVKHGGRFLLMASGSPLYTSDSPLGPFAPIGRIQIPPVAGMPGFGDPMLFSDEDDRLFLYWGCTMSGGIWGAELDANHPTKVITRPVELIPFEPATQPWEALGDWNQDPTSGWVEGSWMLRRNGKYFLSYSAAGTQNRTYAMGCYTAKSPLGPFSPQKRNPIFRSIDGLVTGTGHGCIVAGPEDRLWTFYTIRAGVVHGFERRLGMDRVEVDANGELFVPSASSLPKWLPGKVRAGKSPDTGWLPINGGQPTFASTTAANLQARFAVDNDMRTWWQPSADDARPTLTSRFNAPAAIQAVRLIWRDLGLDTHRGVNPGPFRYRVELETKKDQWTTVLDRAQSTDDLLIDYRECSAAVGTSARLVIIGWPEGITPGVAEFSVFGSPVREP
ncbi:Glycoside hydrolase family 43 [Verrucomicrobia bacterium]|nr:Glycoside hydrolase family 43 [Verrucomicrobiota bacterium]